MFNFIYYYVIFSILDKNKHELKWKEILYVLKK